MESLEMKIAKRTKNKNLFLYIFCPVYKKLDEELVFILLSAKERRVTRLNCSQEKVTEFYSLKFKT